MSPWMQSDGWGVCVVGMISVKVKFWVRMKNSTVGVIGGDSGHMVMMSGMSLVI